MPWLSVNQTLLCWFRAVPTPDLALEVQRGGIPGPPGAWRVGESFIKLYPWWVEGSEPRIRTAPEIYQAEFIKHRIYKAQNLQNYDRPSPKKASKLGRSGADAACVRTQINDNRAAWQAHGALDQTI